jgi:hypothetical protein
MTIPMAAFASSRKLRLVASPARSPPSSLANGTSGLTARTDTPAPAGGEALREVQRDTERQQAGDPVQRPGSSSTT